MTTTTKVIFQTKRYIFMKRLKNLSEYPMWFKLFIAKILMRCMQLSDNDIILYNELRLWVETNGRPTTSNPNYWINKN